MISNQLGRMMTLDEHNQQRAAQDTFLAAARNMAGVLCPSCQTEMVYTNPSAMNLSHPPSRTVKCPKCGHAGLKS